MNDMRGYTELWRYVKVTIVKITRSIKLTRATIQVGHQSRTRHWFRATENLKLFFLQQKTAAD